MKTISSTPLLLVAALLLSSLVPSIVVSANEDLVDTTAMSKSECTAVCVAHWLDREFTWSNKDFCIYYGFTSIADEAECKYDLRVTRQSSQSSEIMVWLPEICEKTACEELFDDDFTPEADDDDDELTPTPTPAPIMPTAPLPTQDSCVLECANYWIEQPRIQNYAFCRFYGKDNFQLEGCVWDLNEIDVYQYNSRRDFASAWCAKVACNHAESS